MPDTGFQGFDSVRHAQGSDECEFPAMHDLVVWWTDAVRLGVSWLRPRASRAQTFHVGGDGVRDHRFGTEVAEMLLFR